MYGTIRNLGAEADSSIIINETCQAVRFEHATPKERPRRCAAEVNCKSTTEKLVSSFLTSINTALTLASTRQKTIPIPTASQKEIARTKRRHRRGGPTSSIADTTAIELAQKHPRRQQLIDVYRTATSGSHLAGLGDIGIHMLSGQIGTCSKGTRGKVYRLVTTIHQLQETIKHEPPQVILYRNPKDFNTTTASTLQSLFKELEAEPDVFIDIQDGGQPEFKAVSAVPTREYLSRMRSSNGEISGSPINALNLSANRLGILPRVFDSEFRLMSEATTAWVKGLEREVQHGKIPTHSLSYTSQPGPGNTKVHGLPADIESCRQFRIIGQAGSISGCHLDNMAPFTAIILHQNDLQSSQVLKYWCIIDVNSLGSDERTLALEQFAKYGSSWKPELSWIKNVPLVAGDCLLMPPGTIHAPITVTDCLFTGGMYWSQQYFVSHTLPSWLFIAQNRDTVTNEDPAYQTIDILNWIQDKIRKDPPAWNVEQDQLQEVMEICAKIQKLSRPCKCTSRTKHSACLCFSAGFHCFKYCDCYHSRKSAASEDV